MSNTERSSTLSKEEAEAQSAVSERLIEWKVLAKIDYRVVPVLCLLYVLAFLDRVNIANAALFGLKDDLRLGGNEYNTTLVIFFVPYVLFEIPSNALMKRFKPHVWLSGCMFMFGLVTCLQGLTQNYGGILTTRFFLGMFECGMFPGCFYLLAMWYKRSEAQKRYTFFFSSTVLAGAFGGLLASAIGKMDGVCGFRGWRWIFILEGILTCVISALLYFIIADFPDEVKWLTTAEKNFVQKRLREDVGDAHSDEKITLKTVSAVLTDYKVIFAGLMYFGLIVPAYGYAYFAPTIIQGLGHSSIQSQLLSVPPYASAFVVSMLVAFCSDHLRHRFAFAVAPLVVAVSGFVILLVERSHDNLKYAALFLAACGTYTAMPVVVCWFSTNLAGHRRRSVAIAWQIGFGNIGGIVASYSFLAQDAPRYVKGYSLCIGFIGFSALASCAYFAACIYENRKRVKNSLVGVALSLSNTERERLGDLNPDYRYLL